MAMASLERPLQGLDWKQSPLQQADMELFYVATIITIGYGHMATFCHAPWLDGKNPMDIAPPILPSQSGKMSW
jgi:hypothetical protein